MTLNKKILFKLKLLALVLALGTACDETQVPEGETPVATTTTTTYAASKVDTATASTAFGPVTHMAKSLNGSTLYVAEAAALHAIDAAGAPVALNTKADLTPAGGAAIGKANLSAGTGAVTHLSPSATGVLVTLDQKNVALYNGVTVAPTNAWLADNGGTSDVTALSNAASTVTAFMTANNNLYLRDLHAANSARFLTGRGTGIILDQVVTGTTAFTNTAGSKAFVASKDNRVFIVEPKGVYSLDDANPVTVAVPALAAPAQAADWTIKGVVGGAGDSANGVPTCVLLNNNKLYIGFTGAAATGGVGIYNLDNANAISAGSFVPTSFADRNKGVVALTAHGNDVYAVLTDKILKVVEGTGADAAGAPGPEVALVGDLSVYYGAKKSDGTPGFHFTGAAVAGAADMGNAVAAEFMGDDLYVGTTVGLYKFTKTTVTR